MSHPKFSKRTARLDYEKNQHAPEHHQSELSRRELLKNGLVQAPIFFTVPTVLSQLFRATQAQGAVGLNDWVFIQIDCQNGGGFIPGQTIPATAPGMPTLNAGGLTQLGVTTDWMSRSNNIDTRFGLPFVGTGSATLANNNTNAASYVSKLAQGIIQFGGAALPMMRGSIVLGRAQDDTNANMMGLGSAITKAGAVGTVGANFGNANTNSGLNHADFIAGNKSGFASSVTDILNAAQFAPNLSNMYGTSALGKMVDAMKSLSDRDVSNLNRMPADQAAKTITGNVYGKNKDYITPPPGLDGRLDPNAQTAFGITAATAANDRRAIFASLLSAAFKGYFSSVSLQLNGYDYHNTGNANQDAMDLAAGTVVGQVMNYAALSRVNAVIVCTTAGGVGGGTASATTIATPRSWNGDRGTNNASYMFVVPGASGTAPMQLKSQLGYYLDNGGTSVNTLVADDPIRGSLPAVMTAMVVNYLILAKREDMIGTLFPGLSRGDLELMRMFA